LAAFAMNKAMGTKSQSGNRELSWPQPDEAKGPAPAFRAYRGKNGRRSEFWKQELLREPVRLLRRHD
jgi:hypothetical protein